MKISGWCKHAHWAQYVLIGVERRQVFCRVPEKRTKSLNATECRVRKLKFSQNPPICQKAGRVQTIWLASFFDTRIRIRNEFNNSLVRWEKLVASFVRWLMVEIMQKKMRAMRRERTHGVTDAYSGGSWHRLKKDFSFCDRWDISNLAVVLWTVLCPNMS